MSTAERWGGEFKIVEAAGQKAYKEEGTARAVFLGKNKEGEKILLAFPSTGKHEEEGKKFLKYLGGVNIEEIING